MRGLSALERGAVRTTEAFVTYKAREHGDMAIQALAELRTQPSHVEIVNRMSFLVLPTWFSKRFCLSLFWIAIKCE